MSTQPSKLSTLRMMICGGELSASTARGLFGEEFGI